MALRDVEKPNRYKDVLRWIASVQVRHPFATLGVLLAITVAMVGGMAQVRTVASLEQMMPLDVEEIAAFRALRDNGLGQDMVGVVVSLDPEATVPGSARSTDYEQYVFTRQLRERLAAEDNVVSVYAFSDVIDGAAAHASVPVTQETYGALVADERVQAQLGRFVNKDATVSVVLVTSDVAADDTRMNLLSDALKDDVASMGRPPGTSVAITGTPIIQQRLGEIIAHDRERTERLSAIFVFLLVALVFSSFLAALVPMASILLSIAWLYGMMGYFGLPISTLAGGVAAMVIGIGVDYSIHLRNKFEYERKKGESLAYAVEETMANTGYVLTTVTIVTALAFLTFLLGEMPEMGRFGLLMTIGVSTAFLLSVVGLPALFIVEEKAIDFARKRFRFGPESELVLATQDELTADARRSHTNRTRED